MPPNVWIVHIYFLLSGSGLLEFGEFCQLAAKFLVEEDEEGLKRELKDAFRIYDKEGNISIDTRLYYRNNISCNFASTYNIYS